jgi:hypothetical protein
MVERPSQAPTMMTRPRTLLQRMFARGIGLAVALLALLAPLTLLSARLSAQRATADSSASIIGVVTDSAQRPIAGVEVYLSAYGRSTRTDEAGRFILSDLFAAPTRVVARFPGWRPADTTVMVAAGARVAVRFALARLTQLEAVRVISHDDCPVRTLEGFDCRRRAGIGVFRNAAELAALDAEGDGFLFVGIPGIRKQLTRTGPVPESVTGWRCLSTIVDGRPSRSAPISSSLIAMEFYDSPEKIPAWYRMAASKPAQNVRISANHKTGAPARASSPSLNCALVVYWTDLATKFDPGLDHGPEVARTRRPPNR